MSYIERLPVGGNLYFDSLISEIFVELIKYWEECLWEVIYIEESLAEQFEHSTEEVEYSDRFSSLWQFITNFYI